MADAPTDTFKPDPKALAEGIHATALGEGGAASTTTNAPVTGALQPPASAEPGSLIQGTAQTRPDDRSRFRQVTDRVANFISGGQQTPGSVWRGILSGALTGMAAGASQGHAGPGMAAGAQAAMKLKQQQFENQRELTREQQEGQLRNAQIAQINHNLWESTVKLSMQEAEASEQAAAGENKTWEAVRAMSGDSKDLGFFQGKNGMLSDEEIARVRTQHPGIIADMAKGSVITTPHYEATYDKDGKPSGFKYAGLHAFWVPPDVMNQRITQPISVDMFMHGDKPGEPGHWVTHTYGPDSGLTNKDVLAMQSKQQEIAAKYDTDLQAARATEYRARAEYELNKGAASKMAADAQTAGVNSTAASIVNLDTAPPEIPRRGKEWLAIKSATDAYSVAHTGKPFPWAKSEADYREAPKYRFALDNMNALVGISPGVGGTLDQLLALSAKIPRSDYPPISNAEQWAKLAAGNADIAAYHGLLLEVADKVGKIIQGGGTNSGLTDAKLKQANDLFNAGFNVDQINGVARTMGDAMQNTKKAYLANNMWLNKWYGADSDLVKNGAAYNQQYNATFGTPGAGGTGNTPKTGGPIVPGLPEGASIVNGKDGKPAGYRMPNDPQGQMRPLPPQNAGGV